MNSEALTVVSGERAADFREAAERLLEGLDEEVCSKVAIRTDSGDGWTTRDTRPLASFGSIVEVMTDYVGPRTRRIQLLALDHAGVAIRGANVSRTLIPADGWRALAEADSKAEASLARVTVEAGFRLVGGTLISQAQERGDALVRLVEAWEQIATLRERIAGLEAGIQPASATVDAVGRWALRALEVYNMAPAETQRAAAALVRDPASVLVAAAGIGEPPGAALARALHGLDADSKALLAGMMADGPELLTPTDPPPGDAPL